MPNLLSRLRGLRPALTRRAFWLWAALITLLRCAVTHFQLTYMWAGGAPLDDELMFRAANAITSGQWLGEYDYLNGRNASSAYSSRVKALAWPAGLLRHSGRRANAASSAAAHHSSAPPNR